jgi:ABC-type transport system involved in multi-copper enzyme maturation permease subunit
VLLVARKELVEQRRQPVMLAVIASLFALVCGGAAAVVHVLDQLLADDDALQLLTDAGLPTDGLEALAASTLALLAFLGFSQYLGIAAVLGGHGMLHERQSHTLVFLLLAPVRRWELLAGKVVGAMLWPTACYALCVGLATAVAATADVARSAPHLTPRAGGWWVTFALATPLWALAVATLCTLLSALARDVRTAQQGVWFVVFFATLGIGGLLTASNDGSLTLPLLSATGALATTITLGMLGTVLLQRDVSR